MCICSSLWDYSPFLPFVSLLMRIVGLCPLLLLVNFVNQIKSCSIISLLVICIVFIDMRLIFSVSDLRRRRWQGFCKSSPNRNRRYLCCDGTIWRKTWGQKCCGKSPYSPFRQICCNKRLHPRIYGRNTKCCGYLTYHRVIRGCCGGRVYDPSTRECCKPRGRIVVKGTCRLKRCGSTLYIHSTQICCANGFRKAVYYKSYGKNTACCGTVLYNKQVRCCDHAKIIRPLSYCAHLLCGKQHFSPASQICCGGRVTYPRQQFSACCGVKLYNKLSQHCCRLTLRVRNKNEPCRRRCGSLYYNPTTHICCANGILRLKRFGDTAKCCANVVYNNATQKCCNNSVIVLKNLACSPCLTQYYDPTRFLCCGGTALRRRSSGQLTRCCGKISYNVINQRCCIPDFVINLPSTCNTLTCGGSPFNPRTQVCCFNRVSLPRRYGSNTECCRGNVYNKVRLYSVC